LALNAAIEIFATSWEILDYLVLALDNAGTFFTHFVNFM